MKILLTDIETAPSVAHVWGLFNQNIGLSQLLEPGRMLCFAAKWHGDKRIEFRSEFHDGKDEMLRRAHALLDEADAVVHYNGRKFDIPHMNREFALAGLPPPAPYKQIDLLKTVRTQFRFASNKLQHVSTQFGLDGKVQHEGHGLWLACMAGDAKAWARMRKYNRRDVVLLEQLHDALLPWIVGYPNANLYEDEASLARCPKCSSIDIQRRGYAVTVTGRFQRMQCQLCGGWFRLNRREDGTTVTSA